MRPRVCPRTTGGWERTAAGRIGWRGEDGVPQIPCGYRGTPREVLVHLIATHRLPLTAARAVLVTAAALQEPA